MSLMKKMITKTVVKTAENVTKNTVRKELNKKRSVDTLAAKSQFPYKLIMDKQLFSLRKNTIFDENNNKKYIIKSNVPVVGKHSMRLYDMDNVEIGSISKVPLAPCYAVSLGGQEIGSVTIYSSSRILFETDRANWSVHGNILQLDYEASNEKGNIVLKVHSAIWSGTDSYVMEYSEKKTEKLGLLLLMAIALIRSK